MRYKSEENEEYALIIPFPRRKRTWLEDAGERAEQRLLAADYDTLGPAGKLAVQAIRAAQKGVPLTSHSVDLGTNA